MQMLTYDGNKITNKPSSRGFASHIKTLEELTMEKFYPKGRRAVIKGSPIDSEHHQTILFHEQFGTFIDNYSDTGLAQRLKRMINSKYPNLREDRVVYVPWDEEKTDIELEAHTARHLLPRHLFGMGIATYDIKYLQQTCTRTSLERFAQTVKLAFEMLDLSHEYDLEMAQRLLRTLTYLKNLNAPINLSEFVGSKISVDATKPLVLTEFERKEAQSFDSDLSRFGLPLVKRKNTN